MPKLAANISLLFRETDWTGRFSAAAQAGFRDVEYQFPYGWPAAEVAGCAADAQVKVVLHNLPAGNAAAGELGIACLPGREGEFREGVDRAIEYAGAVGCPTVNCLAGIAPRDNARERLQEIFVDNLRYAAVRLAAAGIKLVIEPVNSRSVPGFFLTTSRQAEAIVDAVSGNLAIQYDIFHMQIAEGNLASTIERLLPKIGHMQLADAPGRHEPGTGEINFTWLLAQIDRLGYAGWIGCEYEPLGETRDGLGWAQPYLSDQRG
jgi:hydroxypyruvate isomerase